MLVISDRVKESSITEGLGAVTLQAPFGSFQSFSQGIGDGNTTYYCIENGVRWEVGQGVYDQSTNSLSRDVIFDSSSGGSKINLEGPSVVFCTLPADKALISDDAGYINVSGINTTNINVSGIYFQDGTFQNTAFTGGTIGSGNGCVFDSDIVVSLSSGKTFGRYEDGDTIPASGLTPCEVIQLATTEPQAPSVSLSASPTTIETGTTNISVDLTFSYTINNPGATIASVSLEFRRGNSGSWTVLTTNTASTSYTHVFVNSTADQINYRYVVTDSLGYTTTATRNVDFSYKVFYGPSSFVPTTSADVRALSSNIFSNAGSTFTLNTGSTEINFTVALPSTQTVSSVIDLDALNANITSQYVNNPFNVNDAGGNPVAYNVYTMTIAIPYSSNHRHQITKG
jgi:hypothetical protein